MDDVISYRLSKPGHGSIGIIELFEFVETIFLHGWISFVSIRGGVRVSRFPKTSSRILCSGLSILLSAYSKTLSRNLILSSPQVDANFRFATYRYGSLLCAKGGCNQRWKTPPNCRIAVLVDVRPRSWNEYSPTKPKSPTIFHHWLISYFPPPLSLLCVLLPLLLHQFPTTQMETSTILYHWLISYLITVPLPHLSCFSSFGHSSQLSRKARLRSTITLISYPSCTVPCLNPPSSSFPSAIPTPSAFSPASSSPLHFSLLSAPLSFLVSLPFIFCFCPLSIFHFESPRFVPLSYYVHAATVCIAEKTSSFLLLRIF